MMKKSMKIRIGFGSVMMAGVIGLMVWDWRLEASDVSGAGVKGLPLAGLIALMAAMGFLEVHRMAKALGTSGLRISGVLGTVAIATLPVWSQFLAFDASMKMSSGAKYLPLLLLGGVVGLIFLEQMAVHRTEDALRRVAVTALGVLYVGVGSCLVLLLRVEHGLAFLVLFLAVVKFTDIGAYFTGSFLGKHKLIPWLSPGKSWEGLAGGLVTAAGVAVLGAWLMKTFPFGKHDWFGPLFGPGSHLWRYVMFGVVVGAFGQFADLCESLLKRAAGVKDSGAIVPEFGGVLDIADSPLLAAPIALLYVEAFTYIA
ncbi:MAG: phosphatidate cytidylyltransferase [Phycisphaerae bacterium]|nr:phosphatidate cytidylyltransferase [Phycisphaerae bacterium]